MSLARLRAPLLRLAASCTVLAACVQEPRRPRPRSFQAVDDSDRPGASPTRGAEFARGPRAFKAAEAARGARPEATAPVGGSAVSQDALQAEVLPTEDQPASSPFHRFEWNLIRNPDGTLTKLYYFRAQPNGPGAKTYVELLTRFIPGFSGLAPDQDYWIKEKFLIDPRKESHDTWDTGGGAGLVLGNGQVADLFMVTGSEDMLQQIDEFLASLMADVPQVEIETTIVELSLDDELATGSKISFTRGTATDPEGNLIQDVTVKLAENLVNGTFGTFHAIHDETVVSGLLELLQSTTDSEVLSAPKLAVLNGHRAIIDTGSETPFFTPTFSGNGVSSIVTQFKPTGISVVVTPFILTAGMVQLEISVEVSAVTGFVTAAVSSTASVENPLISRRNAHTVVNVPSGKTVMIGGLVTTDDIESVEKVPWLGDIPLLGYLFKRKTTTYRKAQVLFFVKPRILQTKLREAEIYDPADELR
ncbi:MAG: type II and III secretion system protein [Planctomycetes bacterium]|nr:type II and III secretion system protein [Planctomycetota bacterium]